MWGRQEEGGEVRTGGPEEEEVLPVLKSNNPTEAGGEQGFSLKLEIRVPK